MLKLKKSNGIFRVVLTCVILRIVLVSYTLYISSFPKLKVPKYQYNVNIINLNDLSGRDYVHDEDVYLVKTRSYLKGEYKFPVTTFFGFFQNSGSNLDDRYKFENFNKNWLKLIPFSSWDSERFLKAALNDLVYTSMESCAFFPFFPLLIKILSKFGLFVFSQFTNVGDISEILVLALVGVILNNILCVLNCVLIYLIVVKLLCFRPYSYSKDSNDKLCKFKLTSSDIARIGYFSCFVYNVSPGFIFTASVYTEALYSFLNYTVILFFLKSYERKLNIFTELLVILLIFTNCFIRSNSTLLIIPLFFYTLNTCPLASYLCNKYVLETDSHSINSKNSLRKLFLSTFGHWFKSFIYLLVIMLPFVLIQLYGYLLYCNKLNLNEFVDLSKFHRYLLGLFKWFHKNDYYNKSLFAKLDNDYERSWCNWRLPLVYKYVQKRYWGVKLFYSFSSVENALHLLYTLPTIIVIMMYIYQAFVDYYLLLKEALNHKTRTGDVKFKKILAIYKAVNTCEFALLIHLIITMSSFLLFSHVQILFRQSLCLIQYLLEFSIILNNIYLNRNRKLHMALFIYHIILCFVGIILFSNFIGWT